MTDAVSRFTGFADSYDRARPRPPAELVDVLMQWADARRPVVVDLGAGTGLSTVLWQGRASRVTAIEPSSDMREIARHRVETLPDAAAFEIIDATAEETGLPAGAADIVTASQAMHWFDAPRTLAEVARILRPGGVFAAYDCDWPPHIDWEIDAAYDTFERRYRAIEIERGLRPASTDKRGHLGRMRESGHFRYTTEIALHHRESGDGARLVDVARSQGGVVALIDSGATEREIGLAHLRAVATARLAEPKPWWWTYRIRLGVTAPQP